MCLSPIYRSISSHENLPLLPICEKGLKAGIVKENVMLRNRVQLISGIKKTICLETSRRIFWGWC
jgi:hypothetical protein